MIFLKAEKLIHITHQEKYVRADFKIKLQDFLTPNILFPSIIDKIKRILT